MSQLRRQPRQARARQRVDAILDAAAELLLEDGIGGLTTNAIAARAEVPVGSVYQYFSNKEDIVHQVALRSLARMDEALDEVLVLGPSWEALIDRTIDALDRLYREEPGFRTVWGQHGSPALSEADREHDAHLAARLEPLLVAVAPHLKPALRRTVCALVVHVTGPILSLSQRQGPRGRGRVIEEAKRLLKAYLREHIEWSSVMRLWIPLVLLAICAGTGQAAPGFFIEPGPDAQEEAQEALILAKPGQVVEFAAGTFELTIGLSLTADRVTVRGAGAGKTILSFTGQEVGSEGLLVTSDGVVLEGFSVVGTPGDGIKVRGAKGITIRKVSTEWPGKPSPKNGGYGIYPVGCEDVLVEDCYARGASDAGIYVGQSRRVIVRRCKAELNVAGIEIENSRIVDVHDNVAVNNTGGILVFDLPDLPVKGGGQVRVFDNRIEDNDTANFAPAGNIVAQVPRGTGVLIMANREVEIFRNRIGGHRTTNVLVLSYLATGRPLKDAGYDPFPAGVHLHDNSYGKCGTAPAGMFSPLAGLVGLPLPTVVWDGMLPPGSAGEPKDRVCLGEDVTFLNLDLARLMGDPKQARPSRDAAPHRGTRPALTPVRLNAEGTGGSRGKRYF